LSPTVFLAALTNRCILHSLPAITVKMEHSEAVMKNHSDDFIT